MRRLCLLLALLAATPAAAQVHAIEVRTPRPFGYFLGDLVQATVEIEAEDGFVLQSASLPKPGPLTYWLDLRAVETETAGTRQRLRLTYQTFYAALDARSLEVPGFPVTLVRDDGRGATSAPVQVPAWSFGVSPLREVQPPRRDDPADYLRPDGFAPRLDLAPTRNAALGLAALALASLLWLALDRAWWPFRERRARAFALTQRRLAALARGHEGEAAYRDGLLALHRGIDQTDGRRVLADDLPGFLARHPAFRPHGPELARFFAASRLAFFGGGVAAARAQWPLARAAATARGLAAAEREAAS
jgi:mxaA protein